MPKPGMWEMWILLSDQSSYSLKSWGKSLLLFFSPFVLYHLALDIDAVMRNAWQSGQIKSLAFWPKDHESEPQGTRKYWGDCGEWGINWCRNSWTHMHDLTLNNISKLLRTDILASQHICMGLCPGSDGPLAGTHMGQIQIAMPKLWKMNQQNHSPQKPGQNLRLEPNQSAKTKINILFMIETRPRV